MHLPFSPRPHALRRASVSALSLALGLLFAPAPSAATPVISEVLYDASGSDNGLGFVELFGVPGTVLDGLVLEGVNGSNGAVGPVVMLTGVLPADGVFVVADDSGDGTTMVAGADAIANFDFQNGPDSIVLRDDVMVLDAVGYGDFGTSDVFAGEGAPAPDPPGGFSIARVFADVDTDDNSLDFVALDVPTPGEVELTPVPEPATNGLLASALGALALISAARRRRS